MSNYYNLIKSSILTEATNKKVESQNEYTFNVSKKTNTKEIKKAIESIFLVKVQKVRTLNVLPKFKRRGKYSGFASSYKKAMIKLFPGQKIDVFHE
ncbi:50S ribosomal protein L23 [Candidatus Phytoplasma sacchari]|uniref:Large ribosomal subunit protein uL23 n=1 Tax=Candidatus Phytoplasma sacchari TaxID=2609813 RepID=A0ABY7M0K7_9MOLU|nr:50S ribosomal protein L23 [Candidatus Phytoplasma sacchari]KAB8122815.1 50S ribosomal protein L23 [Candidatus Phytoplasma sacchari]WBL31264.1 50S ribosomal protein L23 [Candidatus Phytoplasma sacchari]